MLKKLKVKNFRCLKEAEINLAPITLLYGPNGAGKSSILYTIFVFKNIIQNPNQPLDAFLNLLFANLGGFEQVIYLHNPDKKIEIELTFSDEQGVDTTYGVSIGKKEGKFWIISPPKVNLVLPVTFPYPVNAQTQQMVKINETEINVLWNGITSSVSAPPQTPEGVEATEKFLKSLNMCVETLRAAEIIPLKRGFSKPYYSSSPLSSLLTEDEIATLLAVDMYLEGEVMAKFQNMFGKIFKVRSQIGTALFYLQVTDNFGMTNELINDGFGLNQVVSILTKTLKKNTPLIFIEEPEIHLHPSAQRKLTQTFAEIVKEEEKYLIIETHSEIVVSTFLALVAEKKLSHKDIKCYFLTKPKRETIWEEQTINEKGQIKGGLVSFMETEIENIKTVIGIEEK